jgi:hypothetical protein
VLCDTALLCDSAVVLELPRTGHINGILCVCFIEGGIVCYIRGGREREREGERVTEGASKKTIDFD